MKYAERLVANCRPSKTVPLLSSASELSISPLEILRLLAQTEIKTNIISKTKSKQRRQTKRKRNAVIKTEVKLRIHSIVKLHFTL